MIRILHLEDSQLDRELIKAALLRRGIDHELYWAATETSFLRTLDEKPVDIVLCDSGVPTLEGREALTLVRRRQPDAAFVFLTGHTAAPVLEALRQLGPDEVLCKTDLASVGEKLLLVHAEKTRDRQ